MIILKKLLSTYKKAKLNYKLPVILGVNESGKSEFADLSDLIHILMTGTTGSGKSMFEHTILSTLISFFTPKQLRLYLVDMKLVEFQSYEGLPHLLAPINNYDIDRVYAGLEWLIDEKNRRLRIGDEINKCSYIVVIIDTFSDLMVDNSQKFEGYITKLINRASEVKMHAIMSDSRPSPDVYTPLIRKLFPTKICFNVSKAEDSKLIIGKSGGELLKGVGDMLFVAPDSAEVRIQAPYISDDQINKIINSLHKPKGS